MSETQSTKIREIKVTSLIIGLIAFLIGATTYFVQPKFLQDIEGRLLDARFALRGAVAPSDTVAIVTVDDVSLEKFGRWPWSRDFTAKVLEAIKNHGASTISLDVVFSERQDNTVLEQLTKLEILSESQKLEVKKLIETQSPDAQLANVIEQSGNIITGQFFYTSPKLVENLDPLSEESQQLLSITSSVTAVRSTSDLFPAIESYGVETNIPEIMLAGIGSGYFNFPPSADGLIRYAPLVMRFKNEFYPSLALRALAHYLGRVPIVVNAEDYGITSISLGRNHIPTNEIGAVDINYYGPRQTISTYSVSDLMQGKIPSNAFRDKIVLFGVTAIGVYDAHSTSFGPSFPGLEIQATVLENIISGEYLDRMSFGLSLDIFSLFLIALILSVILPRLKTMVKRTVFSTVVILIFGAFNFFLFANQYWVVFVYALVTWILCYSFLVLYYSMTIEKTNSMIRSVFKYYLHSNLVDKMIMDPKHLQYGGEQKFLTILFSDIRNFTNISESLTPQELALFLECYMDPMTEHVLNNQGTLDKYIGDAIMALYGAPVATEHHAIDACNSALDMINSLGEVERNCPELAHIFPINIGIGIHSGDVIVGNLGSNFRFTYTALGDNVNLSARLEGLTKHYGVQVLISESTYQIVKNKFNCRELDLVRVKGKTVPASIYELYNRIKPGVEDKYCLHWELALASYKEKLWKSALVLFQTYLENNPNNLACEIYIERCQSFIANPPADDWDGVYTFTTK